MDYNASIELIDVLKDIRDELRTQNERLNDIEYRLRQIHGV